MFHNIINSHDGFIKISSEKGTSFMIELPLVQHNNKS